MTRRDAFQTAFALAVPCFAAETKSKSAGPIRLVRLPNDAIQPQIIRDERKTLHLLYYSGDARHGDLFYARSTDNGATLSSALQVNSPGSAIAAGTIRGAQMAVGKAGRVHVAWNGSSEAKLQGPLNPDSGKPGAPMLYTRLNHAGNGFEPERNLMHQSFGLDGGGSVAADHIGNVFVAWHGIATDTKNEADIQGEARRQVWVARSDNNGDSFADEHKAWQQATGACACCGMKIFAARNGTVHVLYRSATQDVHRDIYLITSRNYGKSFQGSLLHKWEINACPMSSMDFAENTDIVVCAWETGGQVYWARLTDQRPDSIQPIAAPGNAKGRKHPRVAINSTGEVLFVWTEGTGWQRGGSLAWQMYDASGKPMSHHGNLPGVPVWSFAAPVANADNSFSILY